MKKQLILGGTILLTSMALHMPSAMAYSSNAEAFADFGNVTGQGNTTASANFNSQSSNASVDGFTLHSDSRVDNYYGHGFHNQFATLTAEAGEITAAESSFSETFVVTGAGAASLDFVWDGTLGADAGSGLAAGFTFAALALDNLLFDSGENVSGTGDTNIDSGGSIALFFTQNDIGTTFDVTALLTTYISEAFILCEQCELVLANQEDGYSAFADFSNTASFSFTGGIAAVPVPAAVWLLGSALMGLVGIRRRKD